MPSKLALKPGTIALRTAALTFAALAALTATALLAEAAAQDGFGLWDLARVGLIFVTTAWLAWGAALALVGLPGRRRAQVGAAIKGPIPKTVALFPIYNEDPTATFARVAAMDRSILEAGLEVDIAILSDTQDAAAAEQERIAFARLLKDTNCGGRIFYRRRTDNRGRKAGNIEDFIRQSGGAYEFAVILDADSLMEGETLRILIARMQDDPQLGLLQTLPKIIGAHSFFGRSMQFSSGFHSPVFTRGLARLQGVTGPFWGHNAIVRVRAFAASCALPELTGPPPFGGHILSHDYVEAALLARAGWKVQVDETIGGSYEGGPENVVSYAKRDRRWCQGNLQHIRLLFAPGLAAWSRFVFLQGIFAYIVSVLWAAFLIASIIATMMAPEPNYFPQPDQLFPVFPGDRTKQITALAVGIGGLLIVPKFAILFGAIYSGRASGFGGALRSSLSVITEILLTSLLAPLMLMYQTRAVVQVMARRDGGWPASSRAEGLIPMTIAMRNGAWIAITGAVSLLIVALVAPRLSLWLLPVCVPMICAPFLISWTSRPLTRSLFGVPQERRDPPVVKAFRSQLMRWSATAPSGKSEQDRAGVDVTA
ncbi:glucans biosynthesis glucosyltransferase MdoH [Roseovarius sp. M141]|uniref:glucans biosynthesis glucosyltransferase MdoH n=1 Tax=Roseovarius sp. M141 TaxID=2583806 RepID=UPI0020CC398E|nr:glucans biosynthesis glucosyltransferase MdoH [Roseovarius sp. M141]MCQ0091750.1 glucans biosynthesis glucosyltransferase MdoH [Roseovarius sp. M141]